MFGFGIRNQIYSLVYVHGRFIRCTYLNPKNYYEGCFVVVEVKGQLYTGRILENSTQPPAGTEGVRFKEIVKFLEVGDRAKVLGWNDVVEEYFNSMGKKTRMRADIQEKYDSLLSDLDEYSKTKNERDKAKALAIVAYLKGEIKYKKELEEKLGSDSALSIFYQRKDEIDGYLTDNERKTIYDKIQFCDSRSDVFRYICERIDSKTRTIKEPNESQAKYRDQKIEDAIMTLAKR